MKNLVIDTNILFSALRAAHSRTRDLLDRDDIKCFSVNFMMAELFKHKERILKNAKGREEETYEYLIKILSQITFISEDHISTENYIHAFRLCKDVDEADTPFVALALELDCEFWTRDIRLVTGLRAKGFDRFFEETRYWLE